MKFLKKNKSLFINLLISLVLIVAIFTMKKIYPFGNYIFNMNNIQSVYIPVYYRIWDIWHGLADVFINWNLNSSDLAYLLAHGALSPTTWLIALFPRNLIINGVSYIIMIKVLCISLITYISIDKLFNKASSFWKILFTTIYTFSNTLFFSFSNLVVLDTMMLLPLLVYAYVRMFKEDKFLMYVILLILTLLSNYTNYMMFFILIVAITILINIFLNKDNKIKKILKTLLYTILSYGIASIVLIPVLNLYYKSYIFNLNYLLSFFDVEKIMTRLVYLIPLVLPIVLTIKQLFIKKDRNINYFIICMLIFLGISIIVEPINLIWHNEVYLNTIFEYSYVVTFFLIGVSIYYLSNNYNNKNKHEIINVVITIVMICMYLLFAYLMKNELMSSNIIFGISKLSQISAYIFLFILSIFIIFFILKNSFKYVNILIIIFTLCQIYLYSYLELKNYMFLSSTKYTENVNESLNLRNDGYNYIDETHNLNAGFSYILDIPSISKISLNATKDDVSLRNAFKYAGTDYDVDTSGGSIFINSLLHNKYVISDNELDEKYYNLIENNNGKYYYEFKNNMPLIIPYSGKIYEGDYGSIIDNNNGVFKTLFNQENDIMIREKVIDNGDDYIISLKPGRIYYFSLVPELYTGVHISLVDFDLNFMEMYTTDSSIISVFTTSKEQTIMINKKNNGLTDLDVGYIDYQNYIDFINSFKNEGIVVKNEKDKRIYLYNASSSSNILLPIRYNDGMIVKVNGKNTDIKKNVFNLASIYVNEGDNVIEISYKLKYAKLGIIVSIISTLLLVLLIVIKKVKKDL